MSLLLQTRRPQTLRPKTPPWLWMNVLGLDAPLVAVIWQDFLSRSYPSVLRPTGRWTLGLTVWAIYLADRLLDIRWPPSAKEAIPHQFCRRNHGWMRMLLALALCADLLLCFLFLRRAVFANGLFIGAFVVMYFGAFPVGRVPARWKPIATSILFTAGVFLVAWTASVPQRRNLSWPAAAFFLLCLGNLVLIRRWELGEPVLSAGRWILLLALACTVLASSGWYGAVALSAAGLAALAFWGDRLTHTTRRVLADAVLLSPLVIEWTFRA